MRYKLPVLVGDEPCILVPVSARLLPVLSGHLGILEASYSWVPGDYEDGYNLVLETGAQMTALCANELVEANNRLYRLLDWGMNGTVYDAGDNPPETITPAIPAVPSTTTAIPGLIHVLVRIVNLLDNALNGAINVDFSLSPSIREQLQAIIDGLGADDADLGEMLTQLEAIAALLA